MTTHDAPAATPPSEPPLRTLARVLRRRRAWVLGVPAMVLAATVLFLSQATPVYQAGTAVRIDEEKSSLAVLEALESISKGSKVTTEMEILRGRALAADVADSLGLQVYLEQPRAPRGAILLDVEAGPASTPAEIRLSRRDDGRFDVEAEVVLPGPGRFLGLLARKETRALEPVAPGGRFDALGTAFTLSPAAAEHDEIVVAVLAFEDGVRAMRKRLGVDRPVRDADIVAVRFEDTDPALARDVVATMARRFIERRQSAQSAEARGTADFLTGQIAALSAQLADAEDALRRFMEGEDVVALEDAAGAQLTRVAETQAERDLLEAEHRALSELLEGENVGSRLVAFPGILRNVAAGELLRTLAELENQRSTLLGRRRPEDPDVVVLNGRIRDIERQLVTIAGTYAQALGKQVAALNVSLGEARDELGRIPAQQITLARLERHAEVLSDLYMLLQTRLKEAEIAAAVEDMSVQVVEPAVLPDKPVRPQPALSLAIALALALALGVGSAVAAEHMDTTLRTREELARATGLAILGVIPTAAGAPQRRRKPDAPPEPPRLVVREDARGAVPEAYRALRTSIAFAAADAPPRTLVVTSAVPGEGKSTTASNLAATIAQQGRRVLLVDADMRRGALNRAFGAERSPGLSEVLLGAASYVEVLHRGDAGAGATLDLLPTGTVPPNPAELLASARMRALVEEWTAVYDAIVIDAPPLNLVTDAAVLGPLADGVVLVARAGATERVALDYAVQQIRSVRARVLGVVLNGVDPKGDAVYGGAAGYAAYYQNDRDL